MNKNIFSKIGIKVRFYILIVLVITLGTSCLGLYLFTINKLKDKSTTDFNEGNMFMIIKKY